MNKALKHFKTITKHKFKVMHLCFRCGLYKQGLLHDLSKYSIVEFSVGMKYYQGDKSPNGVERKEKGYSSSWLHHKGRNKHHFEYWIDCVDGKWQGCKMPLNYLVESFCDRVAASQIYKGDQYTDHSALDYFELHHLAYIQMMHPDTYAFLEYLLTYLSQNGLDDTIAYIKKDILPQGNYPIVNKRELKD